MATFAFNKDGMRENDMPTAVESGFMNDPRTFMEDNTLRVVCGKQLAGQYNFSLVLMNIPSRKRNRRGAQASYYNLTQNDAGEIPMWFLPYTDNGVGETTLPINGADLMVTVQLNGCTFGHAQSGDNSGCYVTHHNARSQQNNPGIIENQVVNNPFDDDVPMSYFHQRQYRKVRFGGGIDHDYYATLIGKRDGHNHWHFYAQRKKRLTVGGNQLWTLKGVVVVNP